VIACLALACLSHCWMLDEPHSTVVGLRTQGQSFEGQVDRQQLSVRPSGRTINGEGKASGRVESLDAFRGLCL
jgi:hypothetical protein